jgi:high-affinity iron transporter
LLFSFLVTLREGIEIALVITILLGYLRQINQQGRAPQIWAGVGVAAVLCLGFGIVLEITSREMSGRALEMFEGFTMLFAVAVLTWMVFWMKRQSAGISRELRMQVDSAISRGSMTALVLLAFSAVAREGFETVLFLFAGSTNAASGFDFWMGGVLGFVVAGVAGVVIYYGASWLPLKQFFLASGVAVIILAAGLLSNGLAELHEAALITDLGSRPWDTDAMLPMTSTMGKFLHTVLGYDSAPTMGQIAAYWSYVVIVLGAYLLWPTKQPPPRITRADVPEADASAAKNEHLIPST